MQNIIENHPPPGYPIPEAIDTSKDGCYSRKNRNQPQTNSIGAGGCVIASGGMCMAWSLGYNNNSNTDTTYMLTCWFTMAIVGAIFSATVTHVIKRKYLVILSSLLVIVSGLLFIIPNLITIAIMIARHLNGFAVGCVLIPSIELAGEEAIKELRGMNAASVDFSCFTLGIFIQINYMQTWATKEIITIESYQWHGGFIIFFGILSLLFGCFFSIESPILYLYKNHELEALECLRHLQKPFVITTETYALLEEHKKYVAYNKSKNLSQSFIDSLPAIIKLSVFRGIAAMTISVIVNHAMAITSIASDGGHSWPIVLFIFCRTAGMISSAFSQDTIGRKIPILGGMSFSGILALALGYIFSDENNLFDANKMTIALILLLIYEFCAAFAVATVSSYLSEAFSFAIKPFGIAFAFIVEMLVHIICLVTEHDMFSFPNYFIALGAISLAFAVFGHFCLPETKKMTLLEAQVELQKFLSHKFN